MSEIQHYQQHQQWEEYFLTQEQRDTMKLTEEQIDRQCEHYAFISDLPNGSELTRDCWQVAYNQKFNWAVRTNTVDEFFDEFVQEMAEAAE